MLRSSLNTEPLKWKEKAPKTDRALHERLLHDPCQAAPPTRSSLSKDSLKRDLFIAVSGLLHLPEYTTYLWCAGSYLQLPEDFSQSQAGFNLRA